MKRWFNYFKDNLIVRVFFVMLLLLMLLIEGYLSKNSSELYQILWIRVGSNVIETMRINSNHVLYYITPIILILNIPTGVMLHTSAMERVRERSRVKLYTKAIKYTLITIFIYSIVTGGVIYAVSNQVEGNIWLEYWSLPFLRIMNLSLIYILIGLYYEKNLNLMVVMMVLFLNIGLKKSWLITTPIIDHNTIIQNTISNILLGSILIILTNRRYKSMEII